MAPKLYMMALSPPVRAVQMTAKTIGLQLEYVPLDMMKKEHLKPEYLEINPQHTVPTLVEEDGFTLSDSHAILTYIVSKYAPDNSLYPNDLKKRAVIDQRLQFDTGVLWPKLGDIAHPRFKNGSKPLTKAEIASVEEAYGFLEIFLRDHPWVAGDSVTVADFSLIPSVNTLDILVPINSSKFPKLTAWLKRAEMLPAYLINRKAIPEHAAFLKSFLS